MNLALAIALALSTVPLSAAAAREEEAFLLRSSDSPPFPTMSRPRLSFALHVPLVKNAAAEAQLAAAQVPDSTRLAAAAAKRARRQARNLALPVTPRPSSPADVTSPPTME